jgi:hypothetical protein
LTTIFELLDRLETEIVSLRSQNLELRTSLHTVEGNGVSHSIERKRSSKKKSIKRSSASAKKKSAAAQKTIKQLELPVDANGAHDGEPKRSLGKRQALGKSLLQFRKTSSPNRAG